MTNAAPDAENKTAPTNLDAAVDLIIAKMKEEDKEFLRRSTPESLFKHHFSWGASIRNELNLWQNKELLLSINAYKAKQSGCNQFFPIQPDTASDVIMSVVLERLQKDKFPEDRNM